MIYLENIKYLNAPQKNHTYNNKKNIQHYAPEANCCNAGFQ